MLHQDILDTAKNYLRPVRYNLAEVTLQTRIIAKPNRLAPSFMIIGAMKAGTTSLFSYLTQHPEITNPQFKEIHYFDYYWSRPHKWYLAHFPATDPHRPELIAGEATPGYLPHPKAAERLASRLPDTKIIVLLRNPVERAISHYFHEKRVGFETRTLAEAMHSKDAWITGNDLTVEEEREWIESIFKRRRSQTRHPDCILERVPMHRAYIARSLYADQLKQWFTHFKREQILIMDSHELFSEPRASYMKTLDFLGLDFFDIGPMKTHLAGKYDASIDPAVIDYLQETFSEPNQRLYNMLGVDYNW